MCPFQHWPNHMWWTISVPRLEGFSVESAALAPISQRNDSIDSVLTWEILLNVVRVIRTVCSCVQVLTGAQRKAKTEAVATCVCLHRRSTNTPPSIPVCVQRDRSWLLMACAADLVSHSGETDLFFLYLAFQWFRCTYNLPLDTFL